MENQDFGNFCKRIKKSIPIKYIKTNYKDHAEFIIKGSRRPMLHWLEMNHFIVEVEGYLYLQQKNGKTRVSYDIWPSKRYKRNEMISITMFGVLYFIVGFAAFYTLGLLPAIIIASVMGLLLIGVIIMLSMWGRQIGLRNHSKALNEVFRQDPLGISSIYKMS